MRLIIRRIVLPALLLAMAVPVFSQSEYWVFFKDKKGVEFDPYEYFDAKAIARRIRNNVPLNDVSDRPLNKEYVRRVSELSDSVTGRTRWFNALAVMAGDEALAVIKALPFVSRVEPVAVRELAFCSDKKTATSTFKTNWANRQLKIMGYDSYKKAGIDGKGVRIAIFDGGFPGVNTVEAFKTIRDEGRLIKTWDFTKNRENVFYSIAHGTMVMSNVGGMLIKDGDTVRYGMATGAEFLLAKTEIRREPFSEEKNWLMAVEWADKNGADIINSSLGYGKERYFRTDMDGKTSLVSRAANMAARKGILVVNSAGNEASNSWKKLITPADADSVLAVGGIDYYEDYHISFSSYGPTADGRMKPNVCALGNTLVANKKDGESLVSGTSFSSPLVAGFAACALQANPGIKTMDLFRLIEKSGHLYPYFDYAHGYGVPQASYILTKEKKKKDKNFSVKLKDERLYFNVFDADNIPGTYSLMYINLQNKNGTLAYYEVVKVGQNKFRIYVNLSAYPDVDRINIYYKGYIETVKIP